MKFNKPEDAPKDGTQILGDFGWPWLSIAIWNSVENQWVLANLQVDVNPNGDDFYYENLWENHDQLRRWIPLPDNTGDTE